MTVRITKPMADQTTPIQTAMPLTGNPARDLARSFNIRVIVFFLLHIPLGFLGEWSYIFSTVYALAVLLYGLRAALLSRTNQVFFALAYIAGAEILWRMNRARVPWEFGKYAMVLIALVAIVMAWRSRPSSRRLATIVPLVIGVALLPAIVITVLQSDPAEARDMISFNLSGLLALAVMALFMWKRPMSRDRAIGTLLALMAPIISIVAIAVFSTLTIATDFRLASNFVTSGNFGPNQVSNMLGLGALAGAMLLVLITHARGARFAVLIVTVVFLSQALLTFARGGVYSFVIGFAAFGFHLMQTPKARGRFLLGMVVAVIILAGVVFPNLNNFTSGALATRFTDLDTTGRSEAALNDLQTFAENPVTGVGVGLGTQFRLLGVDDDVAAHTEYTRLLAEHGLFGLVILILMGWMFLNRYRSDPPGLDRGMAAGMAFWSLSIMAHSAMRLSAIPFAFALALVAWQVAQVRSVDAADPQIEEPKKEMSARVRRLTG